MKHNEKITMTTPRMKTPILRSQWKQICLGMAAVLIAQTPAHACDFNAPVAVCNQETVDTLQPDLTGYFLDTRTTEFWPYVRLLATKSVIQRSVAFRPDATATRAEALKMVMQSLSTAKPTWQSALSGASNACTFADVRLDDWFYGYVRDAVKAGLISCQSQFRPNDAITRQEFAKIAHNALMLFDPSLVNVDVATTPPFTDAASFDQSLLPFARKLRARGVLSGYPDGTFRPLTLVTRGQIAKIVGNAFFPTEGALEFSLGDAGKPSDYFSSNGKINVLPRSVGFTDVVLKERDRHAVSGLQFTQYAKYSPLVSYSSAVLAALAYKDVSPTKNELQVYLNQFTMELVGLVEHDGIQWTDDYRFFVAKKTNEDGFEDYVISIRGTEGIENLLLDIKVGVTTGFSESCTPAMGDCHNGFNQYANYMMNQLFAKDTEGWRFPGLVNLYNASGKVRVTVVGHSLGGAVAHLLHAKLYEFGMTNLNINIHKKIQSYSIGSPISGNDVFANAYSSLLRMHRARQEIDPVAVLGAVGGVHVGNQHSFSFMPERFESLDPPTVQAFYAVGQYMYIPANEPWHLDPFFSGSNLVHHDKLGYIDILRNFINTSVARDLESKATPIVN